MTKSPQKLLIKYLSVSAIKPNPKNPRKHSKKQVSQLVESLRVFGFNVPILINRENQIIAGHGRLLAATECGLKEVPVIRIEHLSDAQMRAFMIADNKLTENAEWDELLLAEHFQMLETLDLDFNLEITGFETAQIDLMIDNAIEKQSEDEEPLPPPVGPAISKPGDLWLLGKHRILCGNSLDDSNFVQLMGKKKAQMVITDPPYNVPINGHVGGLGEVQHREFAMAAGEMSKEQFTSFLSEACRLLTKFSQEGSIHYLFMDWRHLPEILAAGDAVYAELKNLCIWCKDNAGMGAFYRSQHELVLVYKHGKAPHINNFELGQHGRYRTNVWNYPGVASFARQTEEGNLLTMHPTVKPVALIADAISDCSKRGGLVLDSFIGSGTTLIAAEKTGRICYGIELDPLYVDTAIRRWEKLTGKQAVHEATGQTFAATAEKNGGNHE